MSNENFDAWMKSQRHTNRNHRRTCTTLVILAIIALIWWILWTLLWRPGCCCCCQHPVTHPTQAGVTTIIGGDPHIPGATANIIAPVRAADTDPITSPRPRQHAGPVERRGTVPPGAEARVFLSRSENMPSPPRSLTDWRGTDVAGLVPAYPSSRPAPASTIAPPVVAVPEPPVLWSTLTGLGCIAGLVWASRRERNHHE